MRRVVGTGFADVMSRYTNNRCMRRNILENNAASSDLGAASDFNITKHFGACRNQYTRSDLGMAITLFIAGATKRD